MNAWLVENRASERKDGETDLQFLAKTRKRVFGPFKRDLWDLNEETRAALTAELEATYGNIMQRLGVGGSAALVDRIIQPVEVELPAAPGL